MIKEAPAPAFAFRQRPALRVDHPARLVLFRLDIPQFLHADAVNLRLAIALQIIFRFQLLCEMSARTLCKQCIFCVKLHTRHIVGLMAAIAGNAHVSGRDALHRTIVIVEDFGSGEAGKDFDTQIFCLRAEPAAKIAERAGIGALVVHPAGREDVRDRHVPAAREHPVVVLGNRNLRHRAALIFPVRQQLVDGFGVEYRARQDMCADFRSFFKDANRCFGIDLFETDSRRKACRTAADDHHIIGHRLPFAHRNSSFPWPGFQAASNLPQLTGFAMPSN
jgi:hypothetical protein